MSYLTRFRAEVDTFLKHSPHSPLSREQKHNFKGLSYYDENKALVLELEAELLPLAEPVVEMQTSTGDTRLYRRWGRLHFQVDGQEASLTIYSDPEGDSGFFLPFKDATNGKETYGAGRYLDDHRPALTQLGPSRFRVDFNYSYNPYCAYSESYSCPLPPAENWLKVPIRAGEKKFE
ncbi:MAG: DUF1684 domain-containing protein [Chloroflexota bacterium]